MARTSRRREYRLPRAGTGAGGKAGFHSREQDRLCLQREAYLAPASSSDFDDDVLGKYQMEDGDSKKIHFSPKTKTCKWDLLVVYTEDQSKVVWRDIDLCKVEKITIFYNSKTDKTSAQFD